ncbi:hypothetical protein GUITHDRAFT_121285 [Guillardia theta CCMP2712]|uniref:Uncharacterized protein n=1 Tax=Guillardia theta (strain CCMP2712) TaxID=905079 RepID=L1I9E9_GUITC|nr:hypothetical protein GUITHDRAFT_121285 [Guillardia theta CCMP2712]EKX32534.1 hypothetical protein GUITHDRAFT_121285 [Guillardia theta CCMP2712]|eukprot:XP_005819514.1 hypothetical protein GUITHDRAFT_121285 [Guillardia theta CCMP2712]
MSGTLNLNEVMYSDPDKAEQPIPVALRLWKPPVSTQCYRSGLVIPSWKERCNVLQCTIPKPLAAGIQPAIIEMGTVMRDSHQSLRRSLQREEVMWTPAAGSGCETTWPTQLLMPSIKCTSISCAWCSAPMNCLKCPRKDDGTPCTETCASSLLISAVDYFKMQERMKLMEQDTDASNKLTSIACVYMCCKCVRETRFCQIFRYLGGFARKYKMKDNIMVGSHHLVYNPISRGCVACTLSDDKIVNNPKDVIIWPGMTCIGYSEMDSNIPGLIGQHYKHYNSALKLLVNGGTFADVMRYVSNQAKVPRTRRANSDALRWLILDQSHMFTDDELLNPPSDDTRVSFKSKRKRNDGGRC